jgi:hypothetical protein
MGFGMWDVGFGMWVMGFGMWVMGYGFYHLGLTGNGHLAESFLGGIRRLAL